ncbi:unnamed protein product [Symbiodinium necroappetens]|uniref:Uncharacterized protein n=1 Tax=Symbiodinium necroappetens TaxID=1628268 RepID=A0A812UPX6_9DINO|nr:unnamed protein product [Symbiodinium necroappetens]
MVPFAPPLRKNAISVQVVWFCDNIALMQRCLGTEKPCEEPEDHDLHVNDVPSQGFLPPITTYSSKTMAGLAESVAGWRLVGADWVLK